MMNRSTVMFDRSIFASKGEAQPTPDYVPRLKTDEPARLQAVPDAPPAADRPVAQTAAEGGLTGLIRRRVAPRPIPSEVAEARRLSSERAEAAAVRQHETETLTRTIAEQADNGMLYDALRLGLPLPGIRKVTEPVSRPVEMDDDLPAEPNPVTFEEAARERIARPTMAEAGVEESDAGRSLRLADGYRTRRRRKLTARLPMDQFQRFKSYADATDRTYQDIIASATEEYLDRVAVENEARAAPQGATLRAVAVDPDPAADR